ncbi:hypothetical protein B0E38_01799 [Streptomyces sp. 111WW2]|uniref:hypothetical protein n=1 Tax=Streptomyces sp. 111WW2 TaxID=1945515 RepID=UPI000D28C695|nr:hypothetical protein [Streptomyces sp. 111WW2]PSK57954.1 hypothetical protein B0E38_01799 [Streptomyces sp. 111WW2]
MNELTKLLERRDRLQLRIDAKLNRPGDVTPALQRLIEQRDAVQLKIDALLT